MKDKEGGKKNEKDGENGEGSDTRLSPSAQHIFEETRVGAVTTSPCEGQHLKGKVLQIFFTSEVSAASVHKQTDKMQDEKTKIKERMVK